MVLMVVSLHSAGKIEQRARLEKATLVPRRYRKTHGLFRAGRMIFFNGPQTA
jgi:hypothetical protein